MYEKLKNSVTQLVGQAINENIFPCTEVLFARNESVILHEVFGTIEKKAGSPNLRKNSLFDLASLTKPLATAAAVLHLQEKELLMVSDTVASYIPGFERKETSTITVQHLLTHTSGLPDWLPLYEPKFNKAEGWEKLVNAPLRCEPGVEMVYSCLGFILLAELVRRVAGVSLNEYCRRHLYEPLGLTNLQFNPCLVRDDLVPTAYCPYRRKTLSGLVHDENAFIFDGEGGNAGLFGTAEDVYQFCLMLMNEGRLKHRRVFSPETVHLFLENQNPMNMVPRTMGWDYKIGNDEYMSCGEFMPNGSVGHLGFTGTSIWFDPDSKYIVILLSNRVSISREGNIQDMREFRPRIHNLLLSTVM